jgi:hypothetical protein
METTVLEARERQSVPLTLAAGAGGLSIQPDPQTASHVTAIELTPVALERWRGAAARSLAVYGDVRVFFLDDRVFVEPDGFWVKGGATAAIAVAAPPGARTVSLVLANGAAPNPVSITRAGGAPETVDLRASARRTLTLPVEADGVVRLTIASPAGFRPSEIGGSADARYLGVRVEAGP